MNKLNICSILLLLSLSYFLLIELFLTENTDSVMDFLPLTALFSSRIVSFFSGMTLILFLMLLVRMPWENSVCVLKKGSLLVWELLFVKDALSFWV